MTALFVTATGTDVGKTFVTAGLARHLVTHGRNVDAIKPVVSGFAPATAATSDPGVLLAALGRPVTEEEIANISPWRFRAPLAPDAAAQREGRAVDFDALVAFCHKAMQVRRDLLLIEGVGGIMVPLDERHTVLDWMNALRLPLLLVAGSYLGTISHTLSAVDVLQRRELTIAAVVVSESIESPIPLDETVAVIARFVRIPVLGVPRLASGVNTHEVLGQLAEMVTTRRSYGVAGGQEVG
jgi:dethiobiotin synthetase